MSKLKEFKSVHKDQMMSSLPLGNEVDPAQRFSRAMKLTRDNVAPSQQTTMLREGNTCSGPIIAPG